MATIDHGVFVFIPFTNHFKPNWAQNLTLIFRQCTDIQSHSLSLLAGQGK
ncbi:hypothetical protein BH09BAC4_BH09BAC4_08390 [soil metagenome]